MGFQLRTLGHATMLVLEEGEPLIATDPWLVGSVYWRSWWLEKYPSEDEIDLVRRARQLYITHSHPDHFHWPSLRRLGPRATIHPRFPGYNVPAFLAANGYPARVLEPWRWYAIAEGVRIASIPVPIDDSILIVDTPAATVVNLNDAMVRPRLLACLKSRLLTPGKPLVVMKSHSPASVAMSMFRGGERAPMKTKEDYVSAARAMAELLGATFFVPFASNAFFNRRDSRWANEYKVIYEDLVRHWGGSPVTLCPPLITMDLASGAFTSAYPSVERRLDDARAHQVAEREGEEEAFRLPATFDAQLKRYLDEVYFLRLIFRRGIGWRLTTSGEERFYDTRRRAILARIPDEYDLIIELPDQVLSEALANNVLTDLGITMFVRVDTKIHLKVTYSVFLLMGLHDYGHFNGPKSFYRFLRYYLPYFVPSLLRARFLLAGTPEEVRLS